MNITMTITKRRIVVAAAAAVIVAFAVVLVVVLMGISNRQQALQHQQAVAQHQRAEALREARASISYTQGYKMGQSLVPTVLGTVSEVAKYKPVTSAPWSTSTSACRDEEPTSDVTGTAWFEGCKSGVLATWTTSLRATTTTTTTTTPTSTTTS
jgi:type II secretory pathway pseudopilin PulG